jgi:Dipeptidyl aminopeptidases/acylaminoacyl-peptidases
MKTGRYIIGILGALAWTMPCLASSRALNPGPIPLASIRDVRDLGEVSLSPDGRFVAATVVSSIAEGGQTHIWLLTRDGHAPRQLTSSSDAGLGESDPAWSPDGNALYVLSGGDAVDRITNPLSMNAARQPLALVRDTAGRLHAAWKHTPQAGIPVRPHQFSLSPDGRWIALVADDGPAVSVRSTARPGDDAYVAGVQEKSRSDLILVELATMQVREVHLDGAVQSLSWSRDAGQLAVVSGEDDDVAGYVGHAWRVSMEDNRLSSIDGVANTVRFAAWAKGGLVYLARCQEEAPPECLELFYRDDNTHASRALTQDIQGSLTDRFVVEADGGHVVLPIMVGLDQRIARIRLRDGQLTWIPIQEPVALHVASNIARSAWVVVASGPSSPRAVLVGKGLGEGMKPLKVPRLVPANWPRIIPRPLVWHRDGWRLEGLLYMPLVPAAKRVPLVVWIHGGPYGAFQNRYYRLVNALASMGWAVLITNPRGSMGYGAEFASANRNDLGGADFADIMAGTDTALARFSLDPTRMAMIGYSYGGTMTAFADGRTDRFKALVSGAPVIDQLSEYGTEDSSFDDRWYIGRPWEHPDDARRQSPISYVGHARTPLLLLQGEDDTIDPVTQSGQMCRALRQLAVAVTCVVYPRETHASLSRAFGLGSGREPRHTVDLAQRMLTFLSASFVAN